MPTEYHDGAPGFPAELPALAAFTDAGWSIYGLADIWTAVRVRGPQTRVIAATSARQLLERLIAAEENDPPPDDPPLAAQPRGPRPAPPGLPPHDASLRERAST